MGALRQPKLTEPKKPPVAETRKLDQYGRDPESLPEKLRSLSDIEAQTGFSPFFDCLLADLPRLSSGNVCTLLILQINRLSYGRFRNSQKEPRFTATLPISAVELAQLCACSDRAIQRELSDMTERGMISVKTVKNGSVKYVISSLYSKWQELDSYPVWKRQQVVAIDKPEPDEEIEDDEEQMPISKDTIQLFKTPATVRPGRASRAAKVNVGVREVVCQNDSPTVDAAFSAVVQSGRLVVSATFETGERKAKGEEKGNAERHACRALPTDEGKGNTGSVTANPRSQEIISLFDPLLQKSGSRLLSPDTVALKSACAEVGNLPHDALVYFVLGPNGRGSRPISGPRAVAAIIREARQNWEARERDVQTAKRPSLCRKCGLREFGICNGEKAGLCWECADADQT